MPQRICFEDFDSRSADSDRENDIEPIANLRVLLNANLEIFAKQTPSELHHEWKMLAEPQSGHLREDLRRNGRRQGHRRHSVETLMRSCGNARWTFLRFKDFVATLNLPNQPLLSLGCRIMASDAI